MTYSSLLACALLSTAADMPLAAGQHERALSVDQRDRSYLVYVPKRLLAERPPLVLAFHGGGSHAEQMIRFCGLNEKADAEGFVVVYPRGVGRLARALTFNAGNCCGYAQRQGVDDVAFVGRLLDDLATVLPYDRRRVYATGMSNGAMLCYRLASEMADRVAAIAPVAGPMGTDQCRPSRPVPVCHFHGDADQFAAYHGGPGARSLSRTQFHSVPRTIGAWVAANGCDANGKIERLPSVVDDGTRVVRTTYSGPAEVVLYTIEGGGHTWPGRRPGLKYLGPSTGNLSANDVMWEFFQRFTAP